MKATVGRIVLYKVLSHEFNNNAEVAPAIITRVWDNGEGDDPGYVNLCVFFDGAIPSPVTSVNLYDSEGDAKTAAANSGDDIRRAWWPARTD